LLVEDEAIIALNERRMLERHGFAVELVHSGEAAVARMAESEDVDLVLMDIDLGSGIDGTQAARRILERREAPIVFLTAHAEPAFVERVSEITGYGYILKGSGELVLVQSIRMACRLWRLHQDLTAQKERYRLITENMSESVLTVDRELRITYVSPSIEQLTGFTPDEYRSMTPEEALTPASARAVREVGRRQDADPSYAPSAMELERRCKDGKTVWTETTSRPAYDETGRVVGFVATIRDISDRVAQREALRKSEARYRSVVENTNDALIVHDFEGTVTFVNDRACNLLGYSREEVVGMDVGDLHTPASREALRAYKQRPSWDRRLTSEQELLTKDGTGISVEVSAVIIEGGGSATGAGEVQAFVRDIRGRKDAEASFRAIYDQTEEAIAMWDREGRLLQVNPAGAVAAGGNREQLLGLHISEIFSAESAEYALSRIRTVFETGRSRTAEWATRIKGRDRCFLVHSEPIKNEEGLVTAVTTFSTDISDLKRGEQQ